MRMTRIIPSSFLPFNVERGKASYSKLQKQGQKFSIKTLAKGLKCYFSLRVLFFKKKYKKG